VARVLRLPFLALLALAASLALAAPASAAGSWDRLLAPAGTCGAQTDRSASVRAQERAMRCMANFARRAQGVTPLLAPSGRIMRSADRKAADILRCGAFSHTACGRPFTYHMRASGYGAGCYGAGENIAWGTRSLGTVRAIMRSWLASDGHRGNLLSQRFRDHGVALRTGTMGGHGNAAVWVHQLGFRC
jgi:uncharacterized protein YkwD